MRYVFILGFSRTGSTMLQGILNNYTEIGIIPEMHLYWPKILHKDFATIFRNSFGKKIIDSKIDELIELMYSKKIKGLFWQKIEQYNIDIEELKFNIRNSERTIKGVLDALFLIMNKTYKKKVMGAKFPVHFSYADVLLDWYPDCKLIHTIRDPRAIFVSQYYKYKTKESVLKNWFIGISQFVHVNYSLQKVYSFHNHLKTSSNYYLYKYEDVINEPEIAFKKLCGFLEVNYNPGMVNPEVFHNTSLSKKRKNIGIHKNSLNSYRTKLNPGISNAIKTINYKLMREFNYR